MDSLKPNQYSTDEKVRWLSYLDALIKREIIDTHEKPVPMDTTEDEEDGEAEEETEFSGYTTEDMTAVLLAPFPHDELYVAYLKAKIDEENGETARYNNSAATFNSMLLDFEKAYNREYKPLSTPFHIYKGVRW